MFLKSFSTLSRPLPAELKKHTRCNYPSNQHLTLKFTIFASPIERQTIFQLQQPRTLTWLEIFLRITSHAQDWKISWWKKLDNGRLIAFNFVDKTKIVTKRWFWPLHILSLPLWGKPSLIQIDEANVSKAFCNLSLHLSGRTGKGDWTGLEWTRLVKYWLDF